MAPSERDADGPPRSGAPCTIRAVGDFVLRLIISAVAVAAAILIVPGVGFGGDLQREWPKLLGVAVILGLVNAYLRPIVRLLALPISLVTMGLVAFVINVGLLLLVALISDRLGLGFMLAGWPRGPFEADTLVAAFLASLVISIVSTALGLARTLTPGV